MSTLLFKNPHFPSISNGRVSVCTLGCASLGKSDRHRQNLHISGLKDFLRHCWKIQEVFQVPDQLGIFDRDLQLGHKRLCHSHMSNLSISQSPNPPQVALQQEPPDPVEFLLWQGGVPFLHIYRETQLSPKRQSDRNISTADGSFGHV